MNDNNLKQPAPENGAATRQPGRAAAPDVAPCRTGEPSEKFGFGANWARFLGVLDESRIQAARDSLIRWLSEEGVQGKRFLDAGSGSGLFSLAAHQLGARVLSFDVDRHSVECALELRRRFGAGEAWEVRSGSLLDAEFLGGLGEFDIVYSWGVVHHTGAMWEALDLLQLRVAPEGRLWVAIYNDQQVISRIWRGIKRTYVRLPAWLRTPYVVVVGGSWLAWRVVLKGTSVIAATIVRTLSGRDAMYHVRSLGAKAFRSQRNRGMHWWYDLVDWIGGWPFEVAKPEEVLAFLRERGFELTHLKTCGGALGCNEFLFRREGDSSI